MNKPFILMPTGVSHCLFKTLLISVDATDTARQRKKNIYNFVALH